MKKIVNYLIKKIILFYLLVVIYIPALFYSKLGYVTLIGFWAIGDTVYDLSYLNVIKRKRKKKIRVVAHNSIKRLFTFYKQIDKVSTISFFANAHMIKTYSDYFVRHCNIESYLIFVDHTSYRKNKTSLEGMRDFIQITENEQITFPRAKIVGHNCGRLYDDSVLIIPESNSYASDSVEECLLLVIECCKLLKIKYFLNTPHKKIKGECAKIGLNDLLLYASDFKAIIGIRTGLFDFISDSGANILCLYGNDKIGRWMKEEVCSLLEWKGSSHIVERYAEDIKKEELIEYLINI